MVLRTFAVPPQVISMTFAVPPQVISMTFAVPPQVISRTCAVPQRDMDDAHDSLPLCRMSQACPQAGAVPAATLRLPGKACSCEALGKA